MRFSFVVLSIYLILQASTAHSIARCVNDPTLIKRASDNTINGIIARGEDPLTAAFKASSANFKFSQSSDPVCKNDNVASEKRLAKQIDLIVEEQRKSVTPKINRLCIDASLERSSGGDDYLCQTANSSKMPLHNESCYTADTAAYLHFAVNKALDCLSNGMGIDPIDPTYILKKYNNETAFNFSTGSAGGVGIGQLTSDPVHEIAGRHEVVGQGRKSKKIWIPGQAQYILENLMKSTNPSCAPFQKILKKDLDNALNERDPITPKDNYCRYLSPGEGLARSLIYSMGYYSFLRDQVIKPWIEDYSEKMANNPLVLNSLTLIAYGPRGRLVAQGILNRIRLSDSTNPEQFAKKAAGHSPYLNQTNGKVDELFNNLDSGLMINKKNKLDICIEQPKGVDPGLQQASQEKDPQSFNKWKMDWIQNKLKDVGEWWKHLPNHGF